jgi:phenylacetate-CoA ligase
LLYSKLAGGEIGDFQIKLWGSMRDILDGGDTWKARTICKIVNTTLLNAFRMTPDQMHNYIAILNTKRPKLILAYVEAIYELATFAERTGHEVIPQKAIMTSAGALHPIMRETIERVFKCPVFNRYGSREFGDIACERPGLKGLWVAPWGNYVEIVDEDGNRVPDGTEGEILVTSLVNFAMPFVRYAIGDRGVLSPHRDNDRAPYGQVLEAVVGRSCDTVRGKNGALVHGGYLGSLLYDKAWISRYQVIQKTLSCLVVRIVRSGSHYCQEELDDIAAKIRLAVGHDTEIVFEFVDEIIPTISGKYRHIISEIETLQDPHKCLQDEAPIGLKTQPS